MSGQGMPDACAARPPRVVVVGLASCFGCQLQITNVERHLLDVLGQVDLRYWQLVASGPMPGEFDVAVIEGAVTTEESAERVRWLREHAATVIAVGACATTGGIPAMASAGFAPRAAEVYGEGGAPAACGDMIGPRPVSAVVDVDFEVRCCPIDPFIFIDVLHHVLYGSNRVRSSATLCGECKKNEKACFFPNHTLCLGLVTRRGCGARCVNLGRPCNGCAGLSPDANLETARVTAGEHGVSPAALDKALEMFNQVNPVLDGVRP